MKNDYAGDNVRHSPRKVKRWEVIALAACILAGSIEFAEAAAYERTRFSSADGLFAACMAND